VTLNPITSDPLKTLKKREGVASGGVHMEPYTSSSQLSDPEMEDVSNGTRVPIDEGDDVGYLGAKTIRLF